MKATLFSFILCFTALTTFAEVTLRGIITYQNTGEKMKTLQVTARGASPTLVKASTNTEGVFVLVFPNGKVGDLVEIELGTPIYDVVNDPKELSVVLTDKPNYTVRLVICKKGERDANAVNYYNISTKYIEDNYQKRINKKNEEISKLKQQLAQNGSNADVLNKQIYELQAESAKLEEELGAQRRTAYKLAEEFSRIDLSQADSIYRKAFETFKQGDIEGARRILNSKEAQKQEEAFYDLSIDIEKSEARVRYVKENLPRAEKKIADAKVQRDTLMVAVLKKKLLDAQLAILQNKYAEAEEIYIRVTNIDTTNLDNLKLLGVFLYNQNDYSKAIIYNEKGLALSKTDDMIAHFSYVLGVIYQNLNKTTEAETYYMKALTLREKLSKKNRKLYDGDVVETLQNLGRLYGQLNKMPEAEKSLLKALSIIEPLAKANPNEFEKVLSFTVDALGRHYYKLNKMPEAEKYYLMALDLAERLTKKDSIRYGGNVAIAENSLGLYYQDLNKMADAEKHYLRALDIYERLFKNNPQRHEPFLAQTKANLGHFYRAFAKNTEAEKYFLQSLASYEHLVQSNPYTYEPDLANTNGNFGIYYAMQRKIPEAEKYMMKSYEIYERLSKNNSKQFEPNLANIAMNLGNIYLATNKQEAKKYYLISYGIRERWVKINPQQFEPVIASTAVNLGNLYSGLGNLPESEKYFTKSLEIYERLAKTNPKQYDPYVAYVLSIYGNVYSFHKVYDKSQTYLLRSLNMRQTALLNGQTHFLVQYNFVKSCLGILRDSFYLQKNYAKVVEVQNEMAKSSEILRVGIPKGDSIAAIDFNDVAWYQIFAKQYAAAELSAKHAMELDATQIVIKTNWGHALLLQNKDDEAKKMYADLKTKKTVVGKSYRDVLKEDFDALEQAGLDKTQLNKARKWVAE